MTSSTDRERRASAADRFPAVPAELRARAEVRAALGALPRHRPERLPAVAAELPGPRRAAVGTRRARRRHGCRRRRRPLLSLLPLLERLRHPEADAEPSPLERASAAALPALRHPFRRTEHRLSLRVLLEAAGELAVRGVLGQ